MLLRRLHESVVAMATDQSRDAFSRQAMGLMRSRLERAERFVFSESAAAACVELAERPDKLLRVTTSVFAPFPLCWVECPVRPGSDTEFGALWVSGKNEDSEARQGRVMFIFRNSKNGERDSFHVEYDLDNPDIQVRPTPEAEEQWEAQTGRPWDHEAAVSIHKLFYTVLAAWALLATKGMTGAVQPDLSKLNKARAAKGIYPLLAYREVRLNLDAERLVKAKRAVGTGCMPWHMVRAHFRLLRTGRVTIVSSHPRGNAAYGTRLHRYTVTRAEDHA